MFQVISREAREAKATLEAISRSQALIEFTPDGTIITANENFLSVMGYELDEIRGKHHAMFVDEEASKSQEYRKFWTDLANGKFHAGEFKRFGKGGKAVWIQASYNPVLDLTGKAFKIVKFASDITAEKLHSADSKGQLDAINKSNAVIEFHLDGTIITANKNFLNAVGYTLDEIQGKHHSMFVDPNFAKSVEYTEFWASLGRGEFQSAEYKRFGKGGQEIWIQASYNPIFDTDGDPFKVVKYATDVTDQVNKRIRNEQILKVIEENLGLIDSAISETTNQSSNAASASTQTSNNVQAVAAGVEELNASVQEIVAAINHSRQVATDAASRSQVADEAAQRLELATESMGGIVELINGITDQINLLALNATIEAARAGEAGRGFAVVASEVKKLSSQAREATDRIAQEVSDTRTVSGEVVGALAEIRTSIETLKDNVVGVASAIEEQSTVANEISSNMQSAATAVDSISQNISEIAKVAGDAEASNLKVKEAAKSLAKAV